MGSVTTTRLEMVTNYVFVTTSGRQVVTECKMVTTWKPTGVTLRAVFAVPARCSACAGAGISAT